DRLALIRGLADGTIDFVVSDHSPQARENKELEIDFASYGMTALETAVPLMLDLVANGSLGAKRFVEAMATKPRDVFGIKGGRIKAGEKAALTVIDPSLERVISLENIVSKSKNSPFLGKRLKGFPVLTIFSGRITYQAERESKKSR
ncbi:MAG: amidohydrolase family protein, partial [Deltaproteobacteria bacterium]|nr:amidohydrolase family protein [Deltaproteobacteria bacterium]